MVLFLHLFIVNKSGGLIHHRPLSARAPKLSTNDWLRIGSTFHSLHAIAAEASPKEQEHEHEQPDDTGIAEMVAGGLLLRCLQTRCGSSMKFVLTALPGTVSSATLDAVLRDIYRAYADFVLKDPFYELDMPIRSELFVQAVDVIIDQYGGGGGRSSSSSTSTSSDTSKTLSKQPYSR